MLGTLASLPGAPIEKRLGACKRSFLVKPSKPSTDTQPVTNMPSNYLYILSPNWSGEYGFTDLFVRWARGTESALFLSFVAAQKAKCPR